VAGGRGTSFLCSIVRVRACLLWCVVGLVGAAPGQIILSQLHYHTSGNLHSDVSELMAIVCLSAWSSHCSLDLVRSISRRVADVHHYPWRRWGAGQGGCSGARGLVRRWWVCCYSPTLSMECGGSWSKTAWGCPRSTCHDDMCLVACSVPVHRLTKLRRRWCFFGSDNGRGLASLSAFV
jgi:hypothetical protein